MTPLTNQFNLEAAGTYGIMERSALFMEPPDEFPFAFQPYEIQKAFMRNLYIALERGKVGIFESPTGTVGSPRYRLSYWFTLHAHLVG